MSLNPLTSSHSPTPGLAPSLSSPTPKGLDSLVSGAGHRALPVSTASESVSSLDILTLRAGLQRWVDEGVSTRGGNRAEAAKRIIQCFESNNASFDHPFLYGRSFVPDRRLLMLDLSFLQLTTLPSEIGSLDTLSYLDLRENKLTALPETILNLVNLERLHVGYNELTALPTGISRLVKLRFLSLIRNKLSTFPGQITGLAKLHSLNLSYNQLSVIPEEICSFDELQELDLDGNKLTTLPDTLLSLPRNVEVYVPYNPFPSDYVIATEERLKATRAAGTPCPTIYFPDIESAAGEIDASTTSS